MSFIARTLSALGLAVALVVLSAGCRANRNDGLGDTAEGTANAAPRGPRAQAHEDPPQAQNAGAAAAAAQAEAPAEEAPAAPAGLPAPDDVAAPPANAQRTESGLASRVLERGRGTQHPTAQDVVIVHYTGWTTDGEMFDSSVQRGVPISFPLRGVIPGWTEGVQLMVVGETRRLWIPEEMAYRGMPGRPAGMLVFDVQLLGIETVPPVTPDNVAAAPRNAERTASGIASVVLQPGTGTEHPTAASTVSVHYSGWTTDGQMFDSSLRRGREASFPLSGVIPGWTEGVQLMVPGEKRRFWIPGNLAYDGQPGRPQGTLVFDITLISIQ
ncbi:MAG: FKBP-type peptidyl-prolyl cis-trans isomerase [Myxococcales bacterium]|nr:FKBP-type peptidyl-prolyl cis-trans isomerase [Myxococcales bacterium]